MPALALDSTSSPRNSGKKYKLGALYSVITAVLLATQHPFSALAAQKLSSVQFVCVTQCALLATVPLLLLSSTTRRDFYALATNVSNAIKLLILFAIGLAGLVSYDYGLSDAHPIIIAAILDLSPFWAALVALIASRKAIPVSPLIFFGCLAVAFTGAMIVTWSQTDKSGGEPLKQALLHGTWFYAVPLPIFFALSGTLVRKWFSKFEEAASVAVLFVLSAVILIPGSLLVSHLRSESYTKAADFPAILLLLLGTVLAAAAGRVVYQMALTATSNDNGFVSMFLLVVPAVTCLVSIPMSWWIAELKITLGPAFFVGLLLIAAPLFVFSLQSWRTASG